MLYLVIVIGLLAFLGLTYWIRKNYWVPFGLDFVLIENGPIRVRHSYPAYFIGFFKLYFFGMAMIWISKFFWKEEFYFTNIQFVALVLALSVILLVVMLLLVPFLARMNFSALIYSNGIELKSAWANTILLDAGCICAVEFSSSTGSYVEVKLNHTENCICLKKINSKQLLTETFKEDFCDIDTSFSPLQLAVFANMIASGIIDLNVDNLPSGEIQASWDAEQEEENHGVYQKEYCTEGSPDHAVDGDVPVVLSPSMFVRVGIIFVTFCLTITGLFYFLQSSLIPMGSDFLKTSDGLVVRSLYDIYLYAGLLFVLVAVGCFFYLKEDVFTVNEWWLSDYFKTVWYSLAIALAFFFGIFAPQIFCSLESKKSEIIIKNGWFDDKIILNRACLNEIGVDENARVIVYLTHSKSCSCVYRYKGFLGIGKRTITERLTKSSYYLEPYKFPFDVAVFAYAIAYQKINLNLSGKRKFWIECRSKDIE
ncbi:hypothetical protein FJ366_00690 [Candidatus Dependentiae bacterium]|nr:hypothetical protein [Candidatus Dependentiae bacterium]